MNPELEAILDDDDEEIARIRAVRHQISERFGHDPYRLVAYFMELQKEHPRKNGARTGARSCGQDESQVA